MLEQVAVRTSRDGSAWDSVDTTEVSWGQAPTGPGFQLLSLRPVLARHVELALRWPAAASLELDEVVGRPPATSSGGAAVRSRAPG